MINKTRFTDRWLQALKPLRSTDPGYRKAVWDADQRGLCVRRGERVTFYVGKRPKGSPKFVWSKLGDYPALSLADARARAAVTVTALDAGKPPPAGTGKPDTLSFAAAADRYMRECLDGKRTRIEIEQLIRGKLVSALGHLPLATITHEDLIAVLREIADRSARDRSGRIASGGPHAAKKALAYLHGMLRWAAFNRVGGLTADPSAAIPSGELLRGRQFNRQRDHVIADAELRIIWQTAGDFGYPFGTLVQALILTGQRRNEIASISSSEIDLDTGCILIPAERMKNKLVHALPLTPRMRDLLDGLPRFADGDYLFSTTSGSRPIVGFSKCKAKLDKAIAQIGPVDPWQLHDLRRTVRTGLSRAKVSVFEAELVIAHTQSGVHGVYDRHRYMSEKLAALEAWETMLFDAILPTPSTNIIELRRSH
jgi:integrase